MKGYTLIEAILVIIIFLIITSLGIHVKYRFDQQKDTQTVEIVDTNRPTITRSE
jgi:type II secretory pathway pseudopilin PulG